MFDADFVSGHVRLERRRLYDLQRFSEFKIILIGNGNHAAAGNRRR